MQMALPWGFYPSGPALSDDQREELRATLCEGLSDESAAMVNEAFDVAMKQADAQADSPLTFAASGMHPGEDGLDLSILRAGVVQVAARPAQEHLLATATAEERRDETTSVHLTEFPAGRAVVAEREQVVAEEGYDPTTLYGVRATFATPDPYYIAIIDLVTRHVELKDDYRGILTELVLPSVGFTVPEVEEAPEPPPADPERVRRLADVLGAAPTKQGESDG